MGDGKGGSDFTAKGIDAEKLNYIIDLKVNRRRRLAEYANEFGTDYIVSGANQQR